MSYRDYNEPKPPKIPLLIDPRPEKTVQLSRIDESFEDVLAKKTDDPSVTGQEKPHRPLQQQQKLAAAYSTLQTSLIQQGSKHMPHANLAQTEFTQSTQNFETVKDPHYVNYATALQAGLNTKTIDNIRRKKEKKTSTDPTEGTSESAPSNPTEGLTYAHNLNLYNKLSEYNPFKQMDATNYELFKHSDMHTQLTSSFLNPLELLGYDVHKTSMSILKHIESSAPKLTDAPDVYSDNKIDRFAIHSNYHNIENERYGSGYLWTDWEAKESYHFLLKRYADIKNYTNVITQFTGSIKSQERHIQRIESGQQTVQKEEAYLNELAQQIESMSTELLTTLNQTQLDQRPQTQQAIQKSLQDMEEMAAILEENSDRMSPENKGILAKYRSQLNESNAAKSRLNDYVENTALKATKTWWEKAGNYIKQPAMILPFGLLSESAPDVFKEADLKLTQATEDTPSLEKKFLESLTYLQDTFFSTFQPQPTLTPTDLKIDNIAYGKQVFEHLVSQNILSPAGTIVAAIDPLELNPNYGLESTTENQRIHTLLVNALNGPLSFDTINRSTTARAQRANITITDPHGNNWTLADLFASFSYSTPAASYEQARNGYNILFDMLETMAGDNLSQHGKLSPQLINTNGQLTLPIYSQANWQELNPTQTQWQTKSGQPLALQVSSKAEATQLFNTIRDAILYLEPIVTSFETESTQHISTESLRYKDNVSTPTAIRVLTDNQGHLSDTGIITNTSDAFRYNVDHAAHHSFFKTNHWQHIANTMKIRVVATIGKSLFEKSIVNRINQNSHKKKTTEYSEKKKEWEEKEYERIKQVKKKELLDKARRKKDIKKHEIKQKRQRAQMIKEAEKKAMIRKKQEEALRKKTTAAPATAKKGKKK